MDNWAPVLANDPTSFMALYSAERPTVSDCAASASSKTETLAESAHAQTLQRLMPLDLHLHAMATAFNLHWATTQLRTHAPVRTAFRHENIWDMPYVQATLPNTINAEQQMHMYIKGAIIEPAITGAIMLYGLHKGRSQGSHPIASEWEVVDTSGSGATGRPDICILHKATSRRILAIECKTGAADRSLRGNFGSSPVSVIQEMSSVVHANGGIPIEPVNPTGEPSGLPFWKKKMQRFLSQVSAYIFETYT
jgi:hypothetical protein